jgi:hypothetical protein
MLQRIESFSRSHQFYRCSRIFQKFVETKSSLPCPQEIITGLRPEDQSSPYTTLSYLSRIYLNIIFPPTCNSS